MHGSGHVAEDMLDSATNPGLFPIGRFLCFGQRTVLFCLLVNQAGDALRKLLDELLADVSAVAIERAIVLFQQADEFLIVIDRGMRYGVVRDELAFRVRLDMVLVAVVRLIVLLGPACIRILLRQLMLVLRLLPFLRNLTGLDRLVFIPVIALLWSFHKRRVHYDRQR